MAEVVKKKRRIARIGGISGGKEANKLHSDDGATQADCNLVFNIMQSMNKAQNVMSYSQLQEHRSKDKAARTISSDRDSSSKQYNKVNNSRQIKKFVPEKSFPLMKKCKKSMTILKKNRCIPKPRAHVGVIPRPTPSPISNLLPNNMGNNNPTLSNNKSLKDSSVKAKYNSKQGRSIRKKKAKPSHSVNNSCDVNESPKESFDDKCKFIDADTTDSDNEFERFLQNHQPEKSVPTQSEKSNKFKRKKSKKFICTKKIAKVTSKMLSASEDSAENEIECNENKNINKGSPSKRFQRIVDYENSDDSGSDTHVNDIGIFNYDSLSSSEDENMRKSLNKENSLNFNDGMRLNTLPAEQSSISSSKCKGPLYDDALKSLCKTACYVVIERDPLLDKRAASLQHAGNTVKPYDEDDCIIIEASINNFASSISKNNAPSLENRNSSQGELTSIAKSRIHEASNMNDVQANDTSEHEEIICSNRLEPQTKTNSIGKSAEGFQGGASMPLDGKKEVSAIATAARNSLREAEGDQSFTVNQGTGHSFKNVNSIECEAKSASEDSSYLQTSDSSINETKVSLNCDRAKGIQISSVKSLNGPDIIVLSDDEEKDTEAVSTKNETMKSASSEDSDVEIIGLDEDVNKDKCANEGIRDVLNNKTRKEVEVGMKENSSKPSAQPLASIEDDCIILDDLDSPSENTCPTKVVNKVQPSSLVVKTNSNKSTKTSSGNALDSVKNSILETLKTIDFKCINKVLNETSASGTRKEIISAKVGNSTRDNIETSARTHDKLKQTQNDTGLSQKQTSIDTTIKPNGPFEVNNKRNSTTPVDICEKHPSLVQNSNVLHDKSASENVPRSLGQNHIPSNSCNKSSTVYVNSSVPNSIVSEKEVASGCKTESNTLIDSPKIQQLLPVCAKVESYESPSDELDIIAAKSIQSLSDHQKDTIVPLLELYRTEYKKFMEIKCTEQNVTAGLKLLEDKQAKRLLAISSTIKNVVKKDECFHKINNKFGSKTFNKSGCVEKDATCDAVKKPLKIESVPSIDSYPDTKKDDKVNIFNKSVFERASEVLKSDGPSSSQEVYNHLVNSVCAECGKKAFAACSGCAKIFFCSEECGLASWNKGHFATCRR